jgi:tetratricopeptide (TPR) repeat protein
MREPVFAADGHSYEKSAIEQWFATGKRTSPMTNDAMLSTALTPNRQLKSQISEWRSRSSAQQVGELITAVMTAGVLTSDPKSVESKLLELARFVGQSKAVVQPGTLGALRSMLQGSTVWVSSVQRALQMAEAECKLVVASLAARLWAERRDEGLAAVAVAAAVGRRAQLDIEIAAAEEALEKLRKTRVEQVQFVASLRQVERDCAACAAQVEQQLAGYPEPLSLLDEGEEVEQGDASEGQARSKRKRGDEEGPPGTEVAKRQRGDGSPGGSAGPDCEVLMQEGLEWFHGTHWRIRDVVRGRLLIETAAAGELPLAVCTCQRYKWGVFTNTDEDEQGLAFKTLQGLASADTGATPWTVLAAQCNLGLCYECGRGVEKDVVEAVKWYQKAAEQGHSRAQCNLGYMYEIGRGVETDVAEAVKWYRKAAEQGLSRAHCNLGYMYENGRGVEKNAAEAVKWYRKAAEQGLSRAQGNLGYMYESGRGVETDVAEAVKWYRKAAEQGHRLAIAKMARCYRTGVGVDRDEAEASRYEQQLS